MCSVITAITQPTLWRSATPPTANIGPRSACVFADRRSDFRRNAINTTL